MTLLISPCCPACGNDRVSCLGPDGLGDSGSELFECALCGHEFREVFQ